MIGNHDILSAGAPRYYTIWNKSFYVMPAPSATYNAKDIMVLYTKITDDITELEYEFQKLAIKYAYAMAKMKDKQFAEATLVLADYNNALAFEKDDKIERDVDALDKYMIPKTSRAKVKEEM